jgi:archaellum component FlaC
MNNLTWSGNKAKKKVDFKKELLDLEKVLERVKEKYELRPTNPVSSAIVNLNSSIEGLKKEVENMKYLDGKGSDN